MGWFSLPNRREISLLLFSLAVFIFSCNLGTNLSPHSAVFRKLGLAGSSVIGNDGRRPPGLRDKLENAIFGEWRWDQGHIAGDGAERSKEKGPDLYGAQWLASRDIDVVGGEMFGTTTADEAGLFWGNSVPITTLVKHVPGYTILDGAIIFDGSIYIVTDSPTDFPPLKSVLTQKMLKNRVTGTRVEILSHKYASVMLGDFGGKIRGVSFLSTDTSPYNSTLISLWRTYSSLDPSIDASGQTTLPHPLRLFFPHITAFSDRPPELGDSSVVRTRSLTGFHPYTAKAAFPYLTIMYQKDWQDYHSMEVPFVLERVVIADRGAASESGHSPPFSPPFEILKTSKYWWEPIRRTLTTYLDLPENSGSKKQVVTYLSSQEGGGLKLKKTDHEALVKELNKMGRGYGFEILVVSGKATWEHRMTAIARSTAVLGVHGDHFADAVFSKPSPQTTVMEFFPDGTFVRDHELLMRAIGTRYFATWGGRWGGRIFGEGTFPGVSKPNINQEVSVDAEAVVRAIRDSLQG